MPQQAEHSESGHPLREISEFELAKATVESTEGIPSENSKPLRHRLDPRRFDNHPKTLKKPKLMARYAACLTRKDLLDCIPDGDHEVKPKGTSKPVEKWPPRNYNRNFRPPKLERLSLPFSVISCPDLIEKTYESMSVTAQEYLDRPLDEDEKRQWVDAEASRFHDFTLNALGWMTYDDVVVRIDKDLYEPLLAFFPGVIPYITCIKDVQGTTHGIEIEKRDWAVLALGGKKMEPTCLVRFLQMTHLNVCEEIQDIALQSPFVKLARGGRPQWPTSEHKSPKHGKARSILEWVFHAARPDKSIFEGSCNFIKLTDGWFTIWFFVKDGVVKVGPTMTPHLTHITDDPGPNPSIGLVHAFLACASQAGHDHVEQSRILLESEVKKGVASGALSASPSAAERATADETADSLALALALASAPAATASHHDDITQSNAAVAAQAQQSESQTEEPSAARFATPTESEENINDLVSSNPMDKPDSQGIPAPSSEPQLTRHSNAFQGRGSRQAQDSGSPTVSGTAMPRRPGNNARVTNGNELVRSTWKSQSPANTSARQSSRAKKPAKPSKGPDFDQIVASLGRVSSSEKRKKSWRGSSTTPPESTRESTRVRSTTLRFTSDKHKQQSISAVSRDASPEDAHVRKKARRRA